MVSQLLACLSPHLHPCLTYSLKHVCLLALMISLPRLPGIVHLQSCRLLVTVCLLVTPLACQLRRLLAWHCRSLFGLVCTTCCMLIPLELVAAARAS